MNTVYPERHHPVFFLVDALNELGVPATFAKDTRTNNCWGLMVNGWRVIWLIDNRWEHERQDEANALRLDFDGFELQTLVVCAQKLDAVRTGTKWLPLAMTPGYDEVTPVDRVIDAGFIGYIRDASRSNTLIHMASKVNTQLAQHLFGEGAVRFYRMCKIGVNVPTRYGDPLAYDSANMRFFEIPPTEAVLLTPHEDYLADLGFKNGLNCVTYASADDLALKAREVIEWEDWKRCEMASRARELVLNQHTYRHRAEQVLEWISHS